MRLTWKTKGKNANRGTRCVRRNWKRWWPQRGRLSSDRHRRKESASKMAPSKTGCLQGLWHWDQFTEKSVVTPTRPLRNGIALNQIEDSPPRVENLMRSLESVWPKKRKGVVTPYKPDCRHIHKQTNIHTFRKRHTAAHGPSAALDFKTCYLTRNGLNLQLLSTGSSPGGAIQ